MPTIRDSPGSPLPKTKHILKRCRVYSTERPKPYFDWCTCQDLSKHHYPVVEGIFQGRLPQPHIHDCLARVIDRKKTHEFAIYVKNHKDLPENMSVPVKTGEIRWRGDIVVLRRGVSKPNTFVHMRKGDDRLVNALISKFIEEASQGSEIKLPHNFEVMYRK